MKAKLWNIGITARDLDGEIAFLMKLGARLLLREKFAGPDGESEYALLEFGGTRILATPKPVFEDRLGTPLSPGITHAVFETADIDAEYARIVGEGAEVLIEPTEITAAFGSRRIAFFRSPGGFVFEVMQIRELKV